MIGSAQEYGLEQLVSECGPGVSNIIITCEFVRNADS